MPYMMFITMISFMMITTKSPIMIGIYIFIQAFLYTLLISSTSFSTWTAYMLFIVCLGGVLIVFLYVIMTLTIGMDPGKLKFKGFMLILSLSFFKQSELSNSSDTELMNILFEMKFQESFSMEKICSMENMKFSILLMILLFMSMLIVINLTQKSESYMMKI